MDKTQFKKELEREYSELLEEGIMVIDKMPSGMDVGVKRAKSWPRMLAIRFGLDDGTSEERALKIIAEIQEKVSSDDDLYYKNLYKNKGLTVSTSIYERD